MGPCKVVYCALMTGNLKRGRGGSSQIAKGNNRAQVRGMKRLAQVNIDAVTGGGEVINTSGTRITVRGVRY